MGRFFSTNQGATSPLGAALQGLSSGALTGFQLGRQRRMDEEQRQREAEARQYEMEQRPLREALQQAQARSLGIVPQSEATDTTFQIPAMGPNVPNVSLPATVGASQRFKPLGPQYALDTFSTPEAKAVNERIRQTRLAEAIRQQDLARAQQWRTEDLARRAAERAEDREYRVADREDTQSFQRGLLTERANIAASAPPRPADASGLRAQFNSDPAVRAAGDVAASWQKIESAGRTPSAAGDISLLVAYMKLIDPGSTVRENEFATAANAGGVPDRIRAQFNRLQAGERLSPEIRADFVAQARNIAGVHRQQMKGVLDRYRQIAERSGVLPEDVLFDPFAFTDPAEAAPDRSVLSPSQMPQRQQYSPDNPYAPRQ